VEQHRRNIIDDIIIFHLTTDFRPDADVPTVFFRFRFVGIFLLVRFLQANVDIVVIVISVVVTVDGVWLMVYGVWCLGQDELSRYCCGKLGALPYTQPMWVWQGVAQPSSVCNSLLLFICIVFLAVGTVSDAPLEINVNAFCHNISEKTRKENNKSKKSLKQIEQ